MSRRSHKKSKNGCVSCKQRHIKCDEHQPKCMNCQISSFICTYPKEAKSHHNRTNRLSDDPAVNSSVAVRSIIEQTTTKPSEHQTVNLDHLDLLCHFCFETWKEFISDPQGDQSMFNETIQVLRQSIHSSPYLMHQALATAALHLSITKPEQKTHYHSLAIDLQMQAVSLFRNAVLDVDESSCMPAFLFSSLLGVHLLGDSLQHHQDNFDHFLDHFTQYLHLHRGVRAITNKFWHTISQTKLVSHIMSGDQVLSENSTGGSECQPLKVLIKTTISDPKTLEAYQEAINHLQNTFNMSRRLSTSAKSVHAVFAWPVLVSADYINLVEQHKREALFILAYYAVLLHRHKQIWVFGKGGKFIVESICNTFLPDNEAWLLWPTNEVNAHLRTSCSENALTDRV